MTLLEEKSSYRGANEIENWQSFDNYLKKIQLVEDAPAQSKQLRGVRKSKSDSELSKCSCSTDMGSTLSRPKSFHSFEMLEQQNVIKKPSLPDMSDYSEDDYQPLDSTDDELRSQDELTVIEHNSDRVLENIENQIVDKSETQSCGLSFSSNQTNFNAGGSKNSDCASLRACAFDEPHPHNESNDNECENIIGSSDASKSDPTKCMTLPKIKSGSKCSAARRSLRAALDRGSFGNKRGEENNEHELRRSLKKLKPSRSLVNQPLINNESTLSPTAPPHEATQQCCSEPDVFNVLLTEQQLSADMSRPRQYGRRSNPVRISSFAIESSDNGAAVSL